MTDNQSVVEETADNQTQEETVEQTTEENTPETNEESTKKKNNYEKLKDRLGEKIDAEREEKEKVEARLKEVELQLAIAKYGKEVVESEEVNQLRSKYPGMSYEEASKLAGITPATQPNAYSMPGVTQVKTEGKTLYTEAELDSLRINKPEQYNEVLTKMAKGEIPLPK